MYHLNGDKNITQGLSNILSIFEENGVSVK